MLMKYVCNVNTLNMLFASVQRHNCYFLYFQGNGGKCSCWIIVMSYQCSFSLAFFVFVFAKKVLCTCAFLDDLIR